MRGCFAELRLVPNERRIAEAGLQAREAHSAVEARPPIPWDKGHAALHLVRAIHGRDWAERVRVFYAGDDRVTDLMRMRLGQYRSAPPGEPWRVMRRGGDGSDLRWYKGPERCATHVMGAWSDGDMCYVDMDMAHKNQFPFFPNRYGEPFDPIGASGVVTRLSVDLSKSMDEYDMEALYPNNGVLPRQDDRYQTVPYRFGFMPTIDHSKPPHPALEKMPFRPNNTYTMFDHQKGTATGYYAGDAVALQEPCFVPRRPDAPEGDGYVVGMSERILEGNRSELLIIDTADFEAGPVARVQLPFRIFGQVHGWWVSGSDLPDA